MVNTNQEKQLYNNDINPLLIGLVGIIAGAATVTILALSDKDIRKKVTKHAHELGIIIQKWSVAKLHEEIETSRNKSVGEIPYETIEHSTLLEEKMLN